MSWGNKLLVVYIAFAALMATLVYKAVTTKFELVTKDYYKDELRYQDQIDGAANAANAGNIMIRQDGATIMLQLPASLNAAVAEGEAWFYCATNAERDRRIPVRIEHGRYFFDRSLFSKGGYQLKLRLEANETKYYFTKKVNIE